MDASSMARMRARIGVLLEPLPRWWYRMYSTPAHTIMNTYNVPACTLGGWVGATTAAWISVQPQNPADCWLGRTHRYTRRPPTYGDQFCKHANVEHKGQSSCQAARQQGGLSGRARALADGRQAVGQQALAAQHHKQAGLAQQARHGAGHDACSGEVRAAQLRQGRELSGDTACI